MEPRRRGRRRLARRRRRRGRSREPARGDPGRVPRGRPHPRPPRRPDGARTGGRLRPAHARRAGARGPARRRGGRVTRVDESPAISAEYLREVVERLESFGSHPLGFRVAGTPEERAAAAYVAGELRDAGLTDVVEEPVPVDAWRLEEAFVELAGGERLECASFGGVPETGGRGVRGELVPAGRGGRGQLDGLDVAGKVVLVDWEIEPLWPY